MENFLNFMKSVEETVKNDAEAPVIIRYCKEFGLNGKKTITVEGPDSAIFASLCELVPEAIKKNPNRNMQRITLELLYDEAMSSLGFSK